VQVHIEVQRAAEALDEGDDAGAGTIGGLQTRPLRKAGLYGSGDHGQTDTFTLDTFDDFLVMARQQSEPQRLLFVFTQRELPDGSTAAMKRQYEAGYGGHLAPVVCVDKAPEELQDFAALARESQETVPAWDVVFAAALPGLAGQWPTEDATNKALENMVEQVRQGSISGYLTFNQLGETLVLDGG